MKNNYLKTRQTSFLGEPKSVFRALLILGSLMLFAHLSTFAQVPCVPDQAMTITTVDATTATANDAKIRVSGLPNDSLKVGYSTGGTYTGPAFASATKWTAVAGGFIATGLTTPAAAPGDQYTIRVFNANGTCFTDKVVTLPYVNFNYTPQYVDIEATITRVPAGDIPMGSNVTVFVAVKNAGSIPATGVEFTVTYAAGLTFVSANPPGTTTYSDGTKKWIIGTLAPDQTVLLEMVYTVTTRGIKEITAENTALNEVDLDSSPTSNTTKEDDQGQTCITTHMDYCDGDEFTFAIASGNYTGVTWERSTNNGTTWAAITGSGAGYEINASNQLIIKAPGDYRYTRAAGSGYCAFEGCCPVKVIPGLPPILTKPNDEVICFQEASPVIAATNTQTGYPANANTTYNIVTPFGPFLSDQGVFKYKWYNDNGLSNPTLDSIPGQTALALTNLPTAVGEYHYKLISVQDGHTSCNDTTEVIFKINEKPVPIATINSPVCQEDTIFLSATNTAVNPTPGLLWSWSGPAGYTDSGKAKDTIYNAQSPNAGQYIVKAEYVLNGRSCANTDTVSLIVNPIPIPPSAQDTVYCQKITAKKLTALGAVGNVLRWYEGPAVYKFTDYPDFTSPVGYNVGPTPDTDVAAGGYTWYVTQVDGNGCQSHPDTLIVTIDAKPLPPTVKDIAYCENYPSLPLTAVTSSGSYNLIWYGLNKTDRDTAATYPAPPTAVIGPFDYYVSQYNSISKCQSDTAKLTVHIKDTPIPPSVQDTTYCLNDVAVALVATPISPNYLTWYWNGTKTPTAPIPPTTLAGATWAYVTQTLVHDTLQCESPQAPLKITVNPLPVASMIPVSALCIGTASQNNGQLILTRYRDSDVVSWNIGSTYAAATPTSFVAVGSGGVFASNLPNPATANQDYTVRVRNSFGCIINVTAPLVAKDCLCPGGYCEPATVAKTK